MPLQNRVRPDGEIEAVGARGTMMGNRGGCFHRDDKTLKPRRWASRQWICCVLAFKGRCRRVFSPGLYTELFFLDEATALAAGHRPCFECRRAEAVAFAAAWAKAQRLAALPRAPEMDAALHAERLASAPERPRETALSGSLPDGVFVRDGGVPSLVWRGRLFRWTHDGYVHRTELDPRRAVDVITPPAIVAVLRAGYRPQVHFTAEGDQAGSPPKRPMSSE